MEDVVIAGGGLAGLISAIALRKAGYRVTLIEKKEYPFHRVCGEYISNEVRPYLERNDIFHGEFSPSFIHKFWLTATNGQKSELPLSMAAWNGDISTVQVLLDFDASIEAQNSQGDNVFHSLIRVIHVISYSDLELSVSYLGCTKVKGYQAV